MRPPTINDRKLIELIDVKKLSQAKAAQELGVSHQAVNTRLKELRGQTTKVVVAKKIEQVVERKIDAMDKLQKINDNANEILDLLMAWNRGDDAALQVLESQVTTKR
jgi:predicted transcriptional regulator